MKPLAICRFAPHEGPGYFATYLTGRQVPWRLVTVDAGEPLPSCNGICGLALMGGPMSVNDPLPWIGPVIDLVRRSADADVPVIGHCLGGQLMSRAFGGVVERNPVKEIGWGRVDVVDREASALWGAAEAFLSYHWHGESFTVPAGATRIWSSPHCANQAFVLGKHLGMQCHIEITPEMIDLWCQTGADEIEESRRASPAVQTPGEMREDLEWRITGLKAVADRVYDRWIQGLTLA